MRFILLALLIAANAEAQYHDSYYSLTEREEQREYREKQLEQQEELIRLQQEQNDRMERMERERRRNQEYEMFDRNGMTETERELNSR